MARQPLRILCFGDSLTSGYFHYGLESHPYSIKLEDRLSSALPHADVSIVTDGIPGDWASYERFSGRIKRQYHSTNEMSRVVEKNTFDWAIILGGTNDLGIGVPADEIFGALQNVWDVPLLHGTKVLALTVPETEMKTERLVKKRDELNRRILAHQMPNYFSFDLESHIPYHSLSEKDRDRYWDDGLHLDAAGYDWMGNHIADALLEIIQQGDKPSRPVASSSRRHARNASTDEVVFEEEAGSPRNIKEGYVVVRKRDLD